MILHKVSLPPVVVGMKISLTSYGPLSGFTVNGAPIAADARIPWQTAWRAGRGEPETGSPVVAWEPARDLAHALERFPNAVATLAFVSDGTAWISEDPRAKQALARVLCGVLHPHVPLHQDLLQRVAGWQESSEDRRFVSAVVSAPRTLREEVLCLAGDALGSFNPIASSYWAGLKRLGAVVRTGEVAMALARAWQSAAQLDLPEGE